MIGGLYTTVMSKPSALESPSLFLIRVVWNERKLLLLLFISVVAIYSFGLRKPFSVSWCHAKAQDTARNLMHQRAQANPGNAQLAEAARASLYANEDYAPFYRNCMLERGYALE